MKSKTIAMVWVMALAVCGMTATSFVSRTASAVMKECNVARNVRITQKLYEAFGKGDIKTILSHLSDDVQWDVWDTPTAAQNAGVPYLLPRMGRDEVQAFFGYLKENLEFRVFNVANLLGGGCQVHGHVQVEATFKPTHKSLKDDEVHAFTFNEQGQVIAFRHYLDTAKHIEVVTPSPSE